MPSAGRFAARLDALPPDELLGVLAQLMAQMCEELPNIRQHADAVLADRVRPLTQQMMNSVLLSPDLVPWVLAALEPADCAAAVVCRAWAVPWTSLIARRRILHSVPLAALPVGDWNLESEFSPCGLGALPGDRLAIMQGESRIFIVDKQLQLQHTIDNGEILQCLAAGDNGLYVGLCNASPLLIRYHPDTFAVVAENDNLPYRAISDLAIAPSGDLFALAWTDDSPSDLLKLDPSTLAVRYTISGEAADGALGGDGTADYTGGHCSALAVCGEEVFVGVFVGEPSVRVLSTLDGQLLRVILPGPNAWSTPTALCCVADRLYLVDRKPPFVLGHEGDQFQGDTRPGRRIFVLSAEGSTLRVCGAPSTQVGAVAEAAADPDADPDIVVKSYWHDMCCFAGKLLVCESNTYPNPAGYIHDGALVAFEGL